MRASSLLCLALAGALILILSGCVEIRYHLTLNRDNSVDVNYRLAFNKSALDMMRNAHADGDPLAGYREKLQQEGFQVTDYTGSGMEGVQATRRLQSVDEVRDLSRFFQEIPSASSDGSPAFTARHGLFSSSYALDAVVDLSLDGTTDLIPGSGLMSQAVASQLKMCFAVSLPEKPASHNADRVADGGNTLEWQLKPGKRNVLKMQATVRNTRNIMFASVLGLVLVGIIVILRRR